MGQANMMAMAVKEEMAGTSLSDFIGQLRQEKKLINFSLHHGVNAAPTATLKLSIGTEEINTGKDSVQVIFELILRILNITAELKELNSRYKKNVGNEVNVLIKFNRSIFAGRGIAQGDMHEAFILACLDVFNNI